LPNDTRLGMALMDVRVFVREAAKTRPSEAR